VVPVLLRVVVSILLVIFGLSGTAAERVPEPKDVFGFKPGDDYKLASHTQIVNYFRQLDAASDRIVVEDIGKSVEGRPMILAFISSEANIKNRARYKEIARKLALARGVSETEARALAKEGKAIVWIDGGLHATEVAHAQHTPELAWWLVTSEEDEAKRMREQAILLLMPDMNPDGLDIVRDWYNKNLGTPFETTGTPMLYHHYIGTTTTATGTCSRRSSRRRWRVSSITSGSRRSSTTTIRAARSPAASGGRR
jgi:zinc carboxypeptidase